MDEDRRIADADEVPDDSTLLFTATRDGDQREVVLTRRGGDPDGEVVAYENYCQHWTDVRLDKGSGAMVRNGELVCQKHGATFQTDSGYCDFGPCEGAVLPAVEVRVADGAVYLVDDDYAFDHLGPADDGDLSSGSRIGFGG
jgi:nitrite reductase/ring-hydroxylating ferredoxin subunit